VPKNRGNAGAIKFLTSRVPVFMSPGAPGSPGGWHGQAAWLLSGKEGDCLSLIANVEALDIAIPALGIGRISVVTSSASSRTCKKENHANARVGSSRQLRNCKS
jgi:hypothetical protein